jgi:hypothetical protein
MDCRLWIEEARQNLKSPSFPSNRELVRRKIRGMAEIAGSLEQKQALIAFEKELSEPPRRKSSFRDPALDRGNGCIQNGFLRQAVHHLRKSPPVNLLPGQVARTRPEQRPANDLTFAEL